MKKAQLTLFIIIGLVMVLLVGSVLYLFGSKEPAKSEQEVSSQKFRQAAMQPVKDYVESCLDLAAESGIWLLAKQGGVIYKSQGGITPQPADYILYDNYTVNYLIKAPTGDLGEFKAQPDEYPWKTFPYKSETELTTQYFYGYYGISKLPPLFNEFPDSIQEQLEVYVANKTVGCVDWSNFEKQGLSFKALNANAVMLVANESERIAKEEYISFKLYWPIEITDKTTGGVTIIKEFSVKYPLRFASLYYTVKSIIDRDVTNISFDVRNAEGVQVNIANDVNGKDDIINITDPLSTLKGKKLEFLFARENRAPGLFWIETNRIQPSYCKGTIFKITPPDILDISGPTGNEKIKLSSLDPDEDTLTYGVEPGVLREEDIGDYVDLIVSVSDNKVRDTQTFNIFVSACPQ